MAQPNDDDVNVDNATKIWETVKCRINWNKWNLESNGPNAECRLSTVWKRMTQWIFQLLKCNGALMMDVNCFRSLSLWFIHWEKKIDWLNCVADIELMLFNAVYVCWMSNAKCKTYTSNMELCVNCAKNALFSLENSLSLLHTYRGPRAWIQHSTYIRVSRYIFSLHARSHASNIFHSYCSP